MYFMSTNNAQLNDAERRKHIKLRGQQIVFFLVLNSNLPNFS